MNRRLKVKVIAHVTAATAVLAAVCCVVLADVALAGAATPVPAAPGCTTVIAKVPARHWVRFKLTRRVHGHRVVVRRHGKIVYVRAYVRYLKTEFQLSCPPPAIAPIAPVSPIAPAAVSSPPVAEVGVSTEAPVSSGPPTVSGTAKSGEVLTASPGTWSESPTSYTYQWQRCDSSGANCAPIAGMTSQSYTLAELDGSKTVRVAVTASNSAAASTPVSSAQTAVVARAFSSTFGKSSIGNSSDKYGADRKRVNTYTLPTAGLVSRLNIYLQPSGEEGEQKLKGVVYGDEAGKPGKLLGVSSELVFHSTERGAWRALTFPEPLNLPAGTYWIGVITGATANVASFRYDSVGGSRYANANTYTAGPSNPFGTPETNDSEQMSIYATYASKAPLTAPVNSTAPTVSGVAQEEQTLTATPGSWSENPSSYSYQWQRCSSAGTSCEGISTGATYKLGKADLEHRLRVSVVASNAAGVSAPTNWAPLEAAVTSSAGGHHLEYVLNTGLVSVYDMDHGWKSVGTISLPSTVTGIRGVSVSPSTHVMFVSYGGDGGGYGPGSVLAYDLVTDEVLWTANLKTGIDSGQVSPNGQALYMPEGEGSLGGFGWNVLSTADGEVVTNIAAGTSGIAPHNTVVSPDGHYVYLGGRYAEYLYRYDTTTGKVSPTRIGPLIPGVRPFTVNSSNKLAFTTATKFDGFQVSNIETGKVLVTISFGEVPENLPDSAPSHGISLSPDEKELYVVDDVSKEIQVYDVSKASEGAATQLGVIPVNGLEGTESPCAYDCGRGGWLQRSTDGHFVLVADSGDVIETATKKVVANLPTLLNTKISVEIDWEGGVPIATSGRTGVGGVG